jgi:putative oxidoreductase
MRVLLRTDNSPAQLFIRLALGAVMFAHGAQKVLGWFGGPGMEKTIQAFTVKMGFPLWVPVLLMIIEFLGSLGLVTGLFTRLSALGIGTAMGVCAYMNHLQHGFFMNWFGAQKGEGFEFHLLVIGICLALAVKGGGLLSLDAVLAGRKRGKKR